VDTIRVKICYRPLRFGWAIRANDITAFQQAVRLSYALWGGRFNPILIIDNETDTKRLIDLFRLDCIWPIGESSEVQDFPKKFPYLINPFHFNDTLFVGGAHERKHALALDVINALEHIRDKPELKALKEKGIRTYSWQEDDPLANSFLMQFGGYPSVEYSGIDYRKIVTLATDSTEHLFPSGSIIPSDILDHLSIAFLSRYRLERHYSIQSYWNYPGFFIGDCSNLEDLVCFWNLRAADISLWFVDPNHLDRYKEILPAWEKTLRDFVSTRRHEFDRQLGIWTRREDVDEAARPFGGMRLMRCRVSEHLWNGRNVRAPMMHLGEASVLGVMGRDDEGKPKISFMLGDKPFSDNSFFIQQHLVASVSFIGGLYGDDQHTLEPPYIPELNEFYARTMHFHYDKLRIESERIGLIITVTDHDSFLYALPIADLVERIFDMAGFSSRLSSGGLIVRQLIAHLGGVQGARPFKIPGVRRLLKTYGPRETFTWDGALQLIAKKDPQNPQAKFSDYEDLYIEQRQVGTKLLPGAVFEYLVQKGLFRIGTRLTCSKCRMESWISLDTLKQRVVCELCGHEYDATRQLVKGEWHYRRSGVLGAERNTQGAVPVALTLQQLETNLSGGLHEGMHSPSLDLKPKSGQELPACEVDFVWVIPRAYPRKTAVILGECKDMGPIKKTEFEHDVNNLKRVADALPKKHFKTFILFSKLSPFSDEEIELAKSLNDKYRTRVILLTARELEPYHIYERTKKEFDKIEGYGGDPEKLAEATAQIYFLDKTKPSESVPSVAADPATRDPS